MNKALELANGLEAISIDPALSAAVVITDLESAAAELRRLAAVEEELAAIRALEPVAYQLSDPADPDMGVLLSESESFFDWIKSTPLYALPEQK